MNIYFDIILENPGIENEWVAGQKSTFNGLRAFIEQRLMPLKAQIDAEEALHADVANQPYSILHLMVHDADDIGMDYINYSPELTEKLYDCITDDDIDYICFRLKQQAEEEEG